MIYAPSPDSIGYVEFGMGPCFAEMRDFNDWKVTMAGEADDSTAKFLAQMYADRFQSPQDGPVGLAALNDLAEKLHGKAVYLLPIEAPDPNVVY